MEDTEKKTAPPFSLPDADGAAVSLESLKGKWVVLYFYPKDNTPGCSVEAVNFTRKAGELEKLNATVVGVSPDSTGSHRKFIKSKKLGVKLLSGHESTIFDDYGVMAKKKIFGREFRGVARTTFLIDPDGEIAHEWRKVGVNGHADEVKKKIQELQKAEK